MKEMKEITLSEAVATKNYTVAKIEDEDRLVNRLSSMGIICGSEIKVCLYNKKQPVLIFVRDTLVAIGRSESEKIRVGSVGNG